MKKGIWIGCVFFLCISANAQKVDKDLRLQEVEVTAKRPLKNTGIEKTQLDTLVLHDNIALSMADILQQNSTLFIKSYGRAPGHVTQSYPSDMEWYENKFSHDRYGGFQYYSCLLHR